MGKGRLLDEMSLFFCRRPLFLRDKTDTIYMSIVTGDNVGRSYGDFDVFKNLKFSIEHGDQIGCSRAERRGENYAVALAQTWMNPLWDARIT